MMDGDIFLVWVTAFRTRVFLRNRGGHQQTQDEAKGRQTDRQTDERKRRVCVRDKQHMMSMTTTAKIVSVKGREVLDSRGRPTVECELEWSDGNGERSGTVSAMVPSGKSTGGAEAKELR